MIQRLSLQWVAGVFILLVFPALAQPSSGLSVSSAWMRATVAGQESAAAYMTLLTQEKMTLVGVTSTQAASAVLHEMILEGGVMKMRVQPRLELLPGRTIILKPGSYHIMLSGLKQTLSPGQTFPLTLHMEDAMGKPGVLEIRAQVRSLNGQDMAAERGTAMSGQHHQHMH